MNETTIRLFLEAVGKTHWHIDFAEFCRRTGFTGDYAKAKWLEWKGLASSLACFDGGTLAKIIGYLHNLDQAKQVRYAADARLIAAAPELLIACKDALTCLQGKPGWGACEAVLEAAIAKAEGRVESC